MNANNFEYFGPVGSYKETYMYQVCRQMFPNVSENNAIADVSCRYWFLEALQHCSNLILAKDNFQIHIWILNKFRNLQYMFISRKYETNLETTKIYIKKMPYALSFSECNQLMLESTKDYIEVVPKFMIALERNSYVSGFLKLLLVFLLILFVFAITQYLMRKKPKINEILPIENDKNEILLHNYFVDKSMKRQLCARNHSKYNDPLRFLYESPIIAINVKKRYLANIFTLMVKSRPSGQVKNNCNIRKELPNLIMKKFNNILNEKSYCRFIIDIELSDDDSGMDNKLLYPIAEVCEGDCGTKCSTCRGQLNDADLFRKFKLGQQKVTPSKIAASEKQRRYLNTKGSLQSIPTSSRNSSTGITPKYKS